MAGITHLEEFSDESLQGIVDESVKNAVPTLADQFLPTVETFDRKFMYYIVKNSPFIAGYIGGGAEPQIVDRNEMADRHVELAQFGLRHVLTYEELQAINHSRFKKEAKSAIDRTLIDTINLVEGTQRLIQLAKLDALMKGQHEVKGKGIRFTYDFGIPDENKVALTTGNDFDTEDFDIIGFLMDQVQAYEDENGQTPTMLVSRELNAKMLRNSQLITEVGRPAGSTRISQEELNTVLDSFGLPVPTIIKQRHIAYKDNSTGQAVQREFMPVNRIVMLGEGIGEYKLGPTLENNFQPGIKVEAKDKDEPIRSIITTYGAGFPVVENPFLIRHIDAYTPV
ncbi:major capsid protein [Priestia flexa]|uniref:major capsid protein n=1 Tax=Priestia flexa TaxID=86664 RepID=UPI003D2DDBB3